MHLIKLFVCCFLATNLVFHVVAEVVIVEALPDPQRCLNCIEKEKKQWCMTNRPRPHGMVDDGFCVPQGESCKKAGYISHTSLAHCYTHCETCIGYGGTINAWYHNEEIGHCNNRKEDSKVFPTDGLLMKDSVQKCKDAFSGPQPCLNCLKKSKMWCTRKHPPSQGMDFDDGWCIAHNENCGNPEEYHAHNSPARCHTECDSCVKAGNGEHVWCQGKESSQCHTKNGGDRPDCDWDQTAEPMGDLFMCWDLKAPMLPVAAEKPSATSTTAVQNIGAVRVKREAIATIATKVTMTTEKLLSSSPATVEGPSDTEKLPSASTVEVPITTEKLSTASTTAEKITMTTETLPSTSTAAVEGHTTEKLMPASTKAAAKDDVSTEEPPSPSSTPVKVAVTTEVPEAEGGDESESQIPWGVVAGASAGGLALVGAVASILAWLRSGSSPTSDDISDEAGEHQDSAQLERSFVVETTSAFV